MLTLSIKQPWAWLIVNGYKDVENRTWKTKVRGKINVHAGKKFDKEGYEWVKKEFPEIPLPEPKDFDRGGIVGSAEIVDCVDFFYSSWFSGPFGFQLSNRKPVPFVPCKGQLGFFNIGNEEV